MEILFNINKGLYYATIYVVVILTSAIALAIGFLLLCLCVFLTKRTTLYEKQSGYECGFAPYSDAREPFYVKFYLIGILFIIFDVELIVFFSWALCSDLDSNFIYYVINLFFNIFTVGFVYEWLKKSITE
jgi:NADH-quinone oxidoreductase subunit A